MGNFIYAYFIIIHSFIAVLRATFLESIFFLLFLIFSHTLIRIILVFTTISIGNSVDAGYNK